MQLLDHFVLYGNVLPGSFTHCKYLNGYYLWRSSTWSIWSKVTNTNSLLNYILLLNYIIKLYQIFSLLSFNLPISLVAGITWPLCRCCGNIGGCLWSHCALIGRCGCRIWSSLIIAHAVELPIWCSCWRGCDWLLLLWLYHNNWWLEW